MEKCIYDERNGLWHELQGDHYLPCLKLPEEEQVHIGIWGQRHLWHLKKHHRVLYANLLTTGKLNSYLADSVVSLFLYILVLYDLNSLIVQLGRIFSINFYAHPHSGWLFWFAQRANQPKGIRIAAVVYLYQADNGCEWGELRFDFENGTAKTVKLTDWDTVRSDVSAKKAIRYIQSLPEARLPQGNDYTF